MSDLEAGIRGTLRKVHENYLIFEHEDGTRQTHIETTGGSGMLSGEGHAAMMTPETEALYLREQLRHRDRELEELRAVFEMRMRSLADSEATIRTLVRMMADPAQRFHL